MRRLNISLEELAELKLPDGNTMPKMQKLPKDYERGGRWVWWKKDQWVILEDWHYRLPNGQLVMVPAGFISDFASIPRIFHFVDGPTGNMMCTSLLHDWTYKTRVLINKHGKYLETDLDQAYADSKFLWAGMRDTRRIVIPEIMYLLLRVFGRFSWKRNRDAESV